MTTSQTAGEILPFQELSRVTRTLADSYLAHARATLDAIIARPELIERVQLERNGEGYARTLLFGDSRMSAYAILWPPGARTSIHDHHCSCCFGVFSGVISELRFRPIGSRQVVLESIARRERGFVAAMLPSGPNIHQMANEGTEDAVSVHIYGFDHTMHASSIHHEYEVVSQ
ncbi:cysteine dioxygenase [Starkeya sp. ORNL1]|uniref:cysteine dioxygenase n=1 Tax=Starkeya sp. ORNL1 TaxID=2709380 RepID=UPI00146284B7|nr:cysteine dioxygenase family protein [Starkeya sp. ORNL1]QJP13849.1 cysteine dioxygenase [Starkeya sp. ORNL1]